jgi:hypothetical protein
MKFLAGWVPIAVAAAITIPPLVVLYFLKLKRKPLNVSSTLLWKRAVEDLQVNAPFQRLRNNLLLWLQLLILALAAFALGKPVREARQTKEDAYLILIDQSASMNVVEADGRSRLESAKKEARTVVDNMPDGAQAMVLAFSDRARVVSPFSPDKAALRARIDDLESTDSTTTLSEALTLAEAYMQNLVIAGIGRDIANPNAATPARAVVITDGNVADSANLTVTRLPSENLQLVTVGQRSDNVGIVAMDARRNYERPAALEVFTAVRNFGTEPVTLDANLYINDENVDVQQVVLQPGQSATAAGANADEPPADDGEPKAPDDADSDTNAPRPAAAPAGAMASGPPPGSMASIAFDQVDFEGEGVVEVRLKIDDALVADNRAWTIIPPPRHVSVLLVTEGNLFLERLLPALPIVLKVMTPAEYEKAKDEDLTVAGRSRYDVVIFDGHSTTRLAPGSYMFFGGVPQIEGVSAGEPIRGGIVFNWDEGHPILRYVGIGGVKIYEWLEVKLPSEAQVIVEGEAAPLIALLNRDSRQYLICSFPLLTRDAATGSPVLNTDWVVKSHFPVFMFNSLQFLSGTMATTGRKPSRPGEPVEFPVPSGADALRIRRPDGELDSIPTAGFTSVNYANTRRVGLYTVTPGVAGQDRQAVNLYSSSESDVAPKPALSLGGERLQATSSVERVNDPLWPWILLAILAVLAIEWAIYVRRVRV